MSDGRPGLAASLVVATVCPLERSKALAEANARALELAARRRAPNTRRAYAGAWKRFAEWCGEAGQAPLPASPVLVASYIGYIDLEGLHASSVDQALSAIALAHRDARLADPTTSPEVKAVRAGFRATRGIAPFHQKDPLSIDELRSIVAPLWGGGWFELRDGAAILLAFHAALRRSELVDLDAADVRRERQGAVIHLRRAKNDQEGQGRHIPLHFSADELLCPVRWLDAWLAVRGPSAGPLFLSHRGKRLPAQDFARRLKKRAEDVGIDSHKLGGHTPRASFVTTALDQGAPEGDIQKITGHRGRSLRTYDRRRAFAVKPLHV